MSLTFLVVAASLLSASGLPGLLLGWRSSWGPRIAVAATLLAAAVGIGGVFLALTQGAATNRVAAGGVGGLRLALGVDALSAFFALPVFLVGGLASVYALRYWPVRRHPRNGRRLRFSFGLLLGAMVFVTLARDGGSFLVAWEAMALAAYFALTTEERPEVRAAGWLYLLYSHVGTLAIAGFFAVFGVANGDFDLRPLAAGASPDLAFVAALFALLGFGMKAGAMPLHSWLPAAHAAAPSHVSAVMSAVLLKMGVYGLVRATSLLPTRTPIAGPVLLLGAASALFGIVFACGQRDLKRLLAYSSIENVGILLLGLGLALVGRSTSRPELVVLGLSGCLFHVWNHALFKSLLFFGAGSLLHATGTRDLETMGGLARRLPWTAGLFVAGAIAICGLPPGNGFASELLIYLGLVAAASGPGTAWAALAAPVLAATGALAMVCFVKVVGVVFSGTPRSERASRAHEAPAGMLGPMAVLAAACALFGLAPSWMAPALDRVTAVWLGGAGAAPRLATLVPFGWVSALGLALLAAIGVLLAAVRPAWRRARTERPGLPTWDCGYAAASPRLQYTGSSFAELVTTRFAWALRPTVERPAVAGHFPPATRFASRFDDTVLDRLVLPQVESLRRFAARLRSLQQGNLQQYVLYVLVAILALLLLDVGVRNLLREVLGW